MAFSDQGHAHHPILETTVRDFIDQCVVDEQFDLVAATGDADSPLRVALFVETEDETSLATSSLLPLDGELKARCENRRLQLHGFEVDYSDAVCFIA